MIDEIIEPIFSANINNPDDIELLRKYFGAGAIKKALGEGGGGIRGEVTERGG